MPERWGDKTSLFLIKYWIWDYHIRCCGDHRGGFDIIIVAKHVIISFIPAKEGRLIEKNEKQMVLSAD